MQILDKSCQAMFLSLFKEKSDGRHYIDDAIKRGARAIVTDCHAVLEDLSVPILRVSNVRHSLALAAARFTVLSLKRSLL